MADHLGPLLRLSGLQASQLPDANASSTDLAPFLISLVQEALPFIDSVTPEAGSGSSTAQPWKRKGRKTYRDSESPVELFERVVPTSQLQAITASPQSNSKSPPGPETWICRRSVHRDAPAPGTASWSEFRTHIKDHHVESEDAFTPSVVGVRQAMSWPRSADVEAIVGQTRWTDFTLSVTEVRHRVGPRPLLRDRVFPVLQMTCAAAAPRDDDEFLVVSVTLSDFAQGASLAKAKDVIVASYVSVERVRRIGHGGNTGEIEWLMATASDARGALPLWMQVLAVPGQIAKDVPMFLGWMAHEERE